MEEAQNFGHEHPLLLLNTEAQISNRRGKTCCSRCGEKVSAPGFSCVKCRFYLHKKCAEAPLELNHPFYRNHPLLLLENPPYSASCDFCCDDCKCFVYHCSCGLDFHIKCALFTYNIAKKKFKELENVAHEDPLISIENDIGKGVDMCFGCDEPLAKYAYFSLDCGFNLHQKCAELPFKINHVCHRKHPLVLQFNGKQLSCKICQETPRRGFVYCCSPCKFVVHIECVSQPPVIEDKSHQHPFTLFWGQPSFICDACGTEGNYAAYICCACNIMVHKKCISLPHIIRNKWHDHRVFHRYSIQKEDFGSLNCIMCHDELDTERGSYYCAGCNIIFHVNCATKSEYLYDIISLQNEDEESFDSLAISSDDINSITSIIEENDVGEATIIKHFKHIHNLMLGDTITEYDKCCDGCMLPISASFYYCSECDFFLHKASAELPKMKLVWFHVCRGTLMLTSGYIFRCKACLYLSNGFAYKCNACEVHICIRCVTVTPGAQTVQGHEHPLLFYYGYEGQCIACGAEHSYAFCCKDCNFALDLLCMRLPNIALHKCDEHLLELTCHDDNIYPKFHYCDICEEKRDPNRWFYHCATCETCAHVKCVLGKYPFIKVGSIYREGDHQHPLTFVKKSYYYTCCNECGKPCEDLALECAESECNYIVHWECIKPDRL
ncbi:hypothetical protein PTKIN_Ptkin17bG0036700 [Pterospermum kingtungense]